jgi:hypothetical protein
MPVNFSLDGHLARTFENWHALDLSRDDQWHRSTLAGYLNMEADRLANEVGPGHAERWRRVRDLRIIASKIQNAGALGGSCGDLHWSLELAPAAKPEADEAA